MGSAAFLVAAFAFSWVTTSVVLLVVPIIVLSGFLRLKALTSYTANTKKNLEDSNKVGVVCVSCDEQYFPLLQHQLAVDSIDNIRAVASLSLEPKFLKDYEDKLRKPYK